MTDSTYRQTLAEMSHMNPYTDRPFGNVMVFHRGPVVAADGGSAADKETMETERLADVDHTPPDGEGANRVYERGMEGRDDTA